MLLGKAYYKDGVSDGEAHLSKINLPEMTE